VCGQFQRTHFIYCREVLNTVFHAS
jgi:hypothetical protein